MFSLLHIPHRLRWFMDDDDDDDDDDDYDDDDELLLWNSWPTIVSYFQPGLLLEILTIANLWHAISRIWTCPNLNLGFVGRSRAVVITTTPRWH